MPKWTQTDVNSKAPGSVSFGRDTDQSASVDPWSLNESGVMSFAAVGASSYDTTLQRTAAGVLSISGFPVGSGATVAGAGNTVTGSTAEAVLASGITIPSGSQAAGQVYRFVAWGTLTTTASTQTVDLRLRLGGLTGTGILDFGTQQPNGSGTVTNAAWRYTADVVFLSGTSVDVSGTDSLNFFPSAVNHSATTVTNASAQQLVLTDQNSASAVSVTCTGFYCERVA